MHDEPDSGHRAGLRRILWVGGLTLTALVSLLWYVFAADSRLRRELMSSREAARHTREALVIAIDRQTSIRGFRLTSDTALIAADHLPRSALEGRLDSLERVIRSDPAQARLVAGIRTALADWDTTYVQSSMSPGAIRDADFERVATQRFAVIRARFRELSTIQGAVFAGRLRRAERYQLIELALFGLAVAVMGGIIALVARRLRRQDADLAGKRER